MGKLKASTLIEVVVSLVIISTIMTIALMTYVNVIQTDDLVRKTEANVYMQRLANGIKANNTHIDYIIEENEITYQVSFLEYDKENKLIQMEIIALSNQDKVLLKRNEVLLDE